ncbi:MAG: methyltransferase domain-containing protein [Desulfomonilaceae bacterium]
MICVEVLEHFPESIEAIREFSRLLRTGGILS